jgi:hypothetical protein
MYFERCAIAAASEVAPLQRDRYSTSVIASQATQSRVPPRSDPGLLGREGLLAMTAEGSLHPHVNSASTVPSPSSSIRTLSPALSQSVLTRLPVSTSCPA